MSSKKIFHAQNVNISDIELAGTFPYVVRSAVNNGIRGFISECADYLNPKDTLSFAQDTFTVFYQDKPYFTGNKVKILNFKFGVLSKTIAIYLVTTFQKALSNLTWGIGSTIESIAEIKIELPSLNNEPAFSYMENFIETLETERIEILEAYLTVTGLKNYRLTKHDEEVIDTFNKLKDSNSSIQLDIKSTKLSSIFNWCSEIKELNPLKLHELTDNSEEKYPFYGQSTVNNGIIDYQRLNRHVLNNKGGQPTILIHSNNQSVVYLETPFYLKDGHGATSVLQYEHLNRYNALYIMTSIKKIIEQRFNYNAKATKIGLKRTSIMLPYKGDKVENDFMSEFIKVIEKLVIRDLVEWTDIKFKATK